MAREHLTTGDWGEQQASRYLEQLGFEILARNVRTRMGELDIVARHAGVLHIVEVKCRRHPLAHPEQAVNWSKRGKLTRTAVWFIHSRDLCHLPCQFDIIAIHIDDGGRPRIEFFEDAFPATGGTIFG